MEFNFTYNPQTRSRNIIKRNELNLTNKEIKQTAHSFNILEGESLRTCNLAYNIEVKPIDDDIKKIQEKTKNNNAITVVFAFNYGAKSELVNAFKNIIKNKNKVNKINEDLINNNLYTKNIPDPDILIRTGGEKRLSNFLLWQLSYAELFFINKNWPDFNFFDLKKIINTFRVTKRKFGGLYE